MTKSNMDLVELLQKQDQGDFLRSVAEAVLQMIMEADVEGVIGAGRHERAENRTTWRNGYRDRALDTRLGTLNLKVPKLRQGSYFPGFLEARKMSEQALVAVIQEAWIGGVSTRRVDDLVQAMGLNGISKSTVSKLCKDIDERVGEFLNRPLTGKWPYVWLDATYLKQRQGGRIVSVAAIIAVAANTDGRREAFSCLWWADSSNFRGSGRRHLLLTHIQRRVACKSSMVTDVCSGLIGAGDRKSVQPMAARDGEVGYDQLHHFIASGVWDAAPLEEALLAEANKMVGGSDAWLIIDDTALPKKGTHSVGVAPQYASSLGKTANCQSLVSLTLASREVPVMVGLRLFLPESWTSDPRRMAQACVPQGRQVARSKPEIAIEEIDRVIASGVRFGCVLADFGYGSSGLFRQALSTRGLLWAVGLSRRQNVYPADVTLVFPVAKAGKPRKYHIAEQPPVSAEAALANTKWHKVSWRRGTKGQLTCLFAACRVRIADGHKHRMRENRMQRMPGEEVWLVACRQM